LKVEGTGTFQLRQYKIYQVFLNSRVDIGAGISFESSSGVFSAFIYAAE